MTTENLTMVGSEERSGKVSLEVLAKMTGFPVDMIKNELFKGEETAQVSLEELRSAMLTYIDSTMLMDDQK
jgi:5-hydroxyisourate hydrolase-like protein (transthyretin family)